MAKPGPVARCTQCAVPFTLEASPKGGQPAKLCPECRRPRGAPIDPDATNARRNAVRREQRAATAERGQASEDASRASLLAAGLALAPSAPAAAVGLEATGAELERLTVLARLLHPETADGKLSGTARLVTAALHVLTQRLMDQAHLIAPRDLPGAARQLAQVREALVGTDGTRNQYAAVEVGLMGPDNKLVGL